MPQTSAHSGSSYYKIETRDTAGQEQELYAAYRNEQFVVFQLADGVAQVMYLLPASSAADIPHIITQRIIDVTSAKLLPERPQVDSAKLLTSHPWTEMERGIVGVILETRTVF